MFLILNYREELDQNRGGIVFGNVHTANGHHFCISCSEMKAKVAVTKKARSITLRLT